MTARVLRRLRAAEDAEELAEHIAKDSLDSAIRFLENLEATLRHLAEFPSLGGPFEAQIPGLANLRTSRVKGFPNHVIFYIEHSNTIEIVRVLHGARDIEAELGDD